jgi:glycerophosphoryl diester phosphodiesterase
MGCAIRTNIPAYGVFFTMFSQLDPPYFFAHRGASAYAPENTLAAFELAVKQGAPAIEFDVKITSDGHVVVIHDQTVDRTTDGVGQVTQLPLAALRELDAGSKKAAQYCGEKIPTLDEVFGAVGSKLFINVELTNYATPFDALVPKVAELVKKHALEKRVMFSSFFPHNLMNAARLLPNVPHGQLFLEGKPGLWQRAWGRLINIQAEHPWAGDVAADYVKSAHGRRRRVHVWTVNDPVTMRYLRVLGVDAIFTDDPLAALENFK